MPQVAAVDRLVGRRRDQPDAQPRRHRAMSDLRSRIFQIICRRPARAPIRCRLPPCWPTARQPDAQPRRHRAMSDLRSRIAQTICRRPARAPIRRVYCLAGRRRGQPDAQPRRHRAMSDLRSRIVQTIRRRSARAPGYRRLPPCQPTVRPYRRFACLATGPVPSPARPNTGAGRIPIIKSMWTNAS